MRESSPASFNPLQVGYSRTNRDKTHQLYLGFNPLQVGYSPLILHYPPHLLLVSIPYRQATHHKLQGMPNLSDHSFNPLQVGYSRIRFCIMFSFGSLFQSLIGRLLTRKDVLTEVLKYVLSFQSLIGRLLTLKWLNNKREYSRFQSLIGRLLTR